jgi:hypothetical protein
MVLLNRNYAVKDAFKTERIQLVVSHTDNSFENEVFAKGANVRITVGPV